MRRLLSPPILMALFAPSIYLVADQEVKKPSPKVASIKFNGKDYFLRWSQSGQYEFTPAGQEDLNTWSDMLTLWVYPKVTDGDSLALQANDVLNAYKKSGKIFKAASVPRTPSKPAEHFIAALLGNSQSIEFATARFLLIETKGIGIIYSRKAYGKVSASELGPWVVKNGSIIEKLLMELDPSSTVLSIAK